VDGFGVHPSGSTPNEPEWMGRLRKQLYNVLEHGSGRSPGLTFRSSFRSETLLWHDATPETSGRLEALRNSNSTE